MKKNYFGMKAVLCLVLLGIYAGTTQIASVTNTVNGRELPIYSVETEEKKVALSFDAAWGNSILC